MYKLTKEWWIFHMKWFIFIFVLMMVGRWATDSPSIPWVIAISYISGVVYGSLPKPWHDDD